MVVLFKYLSGLSRTYNSSRAGHPDLHYAILARFKVVRSSGRQRNVNVIVYSLIWCKFRVSIYTSDNFDIDYPGFKTSIVACKFSKHLSISGDEWASSAHRRSALHMVIHQSLLVFHIMSQMSASMNEVNFEETRLIKLDVDCVIVMCAISYGISAKIRVVSREHISPAIAPCGSSLRMKSLPCDA
jgi:hypothetical protein